MNPYAAYYINQAGSGLRGYAGNRYQRGHGWFGRLFSSAILPAIKYLGKQTLSTGMDVADDVLAGKNFKNSIKERSLDLGKQTLRTGIKRGRKYIQTGKGIKKRKICKNKIIKKERTLF